MEEEEIQRIQKERQDYVKNIGIEYKFGCYEEKRADSCHLLAEYLEAIDLNFKNAFQLLKQNCEERGYAKSCFKYGMYILAGKECTPNLKDMLKPMQIACDGNIAQGCRYLSLVHWNATKDKPIDTKKAEQYMKRACDMEDGEACWLLSSWYMGNKEKFVTGPGGETKEFDKTNIGSLERNMEKSLLYGTKACEYDIPYSCVNVSRMYRIGDGVEKNPDLAKKYADKAKELIDVLKKRDSSAGFTG